MYIFDLDGTLTDTNGTWAEVVRAFLTRRGLHATAEYRKTLARSIYPTAAQFTRNYYHLPDTPGQIMAEWDALAERHYREVAQLKPGADQYLRKCRAQGRAMALFTACRPALCQAVLERFGLLELFDRVVFAEELGLEKQNPMCLIKLGEVVGAPPTECTLFDDSPDNCTAAAQVGMDTVGVYDPYYEARQEELWAVCRRYVRSLEELL